MSKHRLMKKLLLAVPVLLTVALGAQVVVSPAGGPSQVATLLTGNGVVMSNVVITGDTSAFGNFTSVGSSLGMNGGLVITTGAAANVIGPNNSASQSACVGTTLNDPELMTIEPMATNDVCIIEMDCVPNDDTLYFNYVFGSEEHPEFVFSAFNDAFGIFVNGTNPAGGNYTNTNMTVLPNGAPVCIDSVNATANSSYYVNNTDTMLQYDGLTTNLTAIIPVVPGMTYHIKIIVGDAGDCIYDSGVFLQAGSFRCSGQPLDAPAPLPVKEEVIAYPVPATTNINFAFSTLTDQNVDIVLYSPDGKAVLARNSQAVNNVISLDVSSLAKGTYLAEIIHDGARETKRIVIGE
jgi:hypothetical protein